MRETVATGFDTLPGPAAGAAATGYGAALGREASNKIRGVQAP